MTQSYSVEQMVPQAHYTLLFQLAVYLIHDLHAVVHLSQNIFKNLYMMDGWMDAGLSSFTSIVGS